MCPPLMAVAMAASALGGVASAVGAKQQGDAAASAASYQAQVARNNALMATQQAQANSEQQARRNSSQLGQMRAVQGANGTDVNSGSALDAQQGLAMSGGMDITNTRYAGAAQSQSLNQQSTLDEYQSANDRSAGNAAMMGGLLSTAGQFAGKWGSYGNPAAAAGAAGVG